MADQVTFVLRTRPVYRQVRIQFKRRTTTDPQEKNVFRKKENSQMLAAKGELHAPTNRKDPDSRPSNSYFLRSYSFYMRVRNW